MGALVGIESIRRTNKTIDEMHARTKLAYHELLHGDRGQLPEGFDDMGGDLIGGDQTHNHYHGLPGGSKLLKGAAIAAFGLGTGGLGFAFPDIIDALKPDEKPPVVAPQVSDKEPGIGFLELGEPD